MIIVKNGLKEKNIYNCRKWNGYSSYKSWKRVLLFLLLCLVVAFPAQAQLIDIGLNPLGLDLGSRPLAMGGAFAGMADDVNAPFYNPAGLAWVKGISLSMSGVQNLMATQAYPTGYGASFGLTVLTNKISNIPVQGGVEDSTSNVVYLSFGTKLTFLPSYLQDVNLQRIGLGLNIKALMTQTLRKTGSFDRSANGWDMDLGVLWKGGEWWSAGLSLQNIVPPGAFGGGTIKWDVGGDESIPGTARLAASARVIGDIDSPIFMEGRTLSLASELDICSGHPLLFRLGGEWDFGKFVYLRTGLMQQQSSRGVASNINFGGGVRFENLGVDFVSYFEAQNSQRVFYLSFLYLPKEWIVVKKLEVEKPAMILEEPFEMISLEDNLVTYSDKIDVYGKVKQGVTVVVNGLTANVDEDSNFKVVVPLKKEKNLVVVEARYAGEKKFWKYKVLRKSLVRVAEEEEVKKSLQQAVSKEEKEKLSQKEKSIKQGKEKVEALVTMGVIEITPEAAFVMDAGITRGELSSWLVKATGVTLPEVDKDVFRDVPKNHPLASYIKVMSDLKLLSPFPDGTFRPEALVTKEEGEGIFKRLGAGK